MTDIDAIRKTQRWHVLLNAFDSFHSEVVLAKALDAAISAYDAKCEELAREREAHAVTLTKSAEKLADACAERDAAVRDARRSPWVPADKAPAGHGGIVRVEMAEGMWRYEFGEWRVARGIEGWFNNEGGVLNGVTLWMPIPDDKAALSQARPSDPTTPKGDL